MLKEASITIFLLLVTSLKAFAQDAGPIKTLTFEPVDSSRQRVVPVKVYLANTQSSAPVIMFSHGLGGSRNNSAYLGNHWAMNGYTCVFIQHHGSDEEVWKDVPLRERMAAMKKAANLKSSLDRFKDIPFVLDQLEKWNSDASHSLYGKLDLDHIGMTGHSYGAVTSQALMGQKYPLNQNYADSRIDAFMPMSPSVNRRSSEKAFGDIKAPVLCMTGTKDGGVINPATTPESRKKVYSGLPAGDKYQLVFKDAEHHAFGDSQGRRSKKRIAHHHPAILAISTQFWNAYLKGDAKAKALLQSNEVREAAKLVEGDVWQWK